jgi:hypothetical protein
VASFMVPRKESNISLLVEPGILEGSKE